MKRFVQHYRRIASVPMVTLPVVGCRGWRLAIDPKGLEADHLAWLIPIFTIVLSVIWLVVMIVVRVAVLKRRVQRAVFSSPHVTRPSTSDAAPRSWNTGDSYGDHRTCSDRSQLHRP